MGGFVRRLDSHLYQTYQAVAPEDTHWRQATCEEVGCAHGENGWKTVIDETSALGQMQAHYIRRQSGRKFVEERGEDGMTVFTFASGQPCFKQHKTKIDRQELFLVRGGDARGNPLGQVRRHTRPEDWIEDFQINQDNLMSAIERG